MSKFTWIVVIVTWVYAYVQTHQTVYTICSFFVYQLYLNKAGKKKKKKSYHHFNDETNAEPPIKRWA